MEEPPSWIPLLIIFLGGPAVIIFIIYTIRYFIRIQRAKLEPIAQALGGEIIFGVVSGTYLRLQNSGIENIIRITQGSKNSPPALFIHQMLKLDFDLVIQKENIVTKKLEQWHLLKEVKTGDPLFDQNYLIRSQSPEKAQHFLLSGTRRGAVDYFFANGFSSLKINKLSVFIVKKNYTKPDLEPDKIRNHLEQLNKFITG